MKRGALFFILGVLLIGSFASVSAVKECRYDLTRVLPPYGVDDYRCAGNDGVCQGYYYQGPADEQYFVSYTAIYWKSTKMYEKSEYSNSCVAFKGISNEGYNYTRGNLISGATCGGSYEICREPAQCGDDICVAEEQCNYVGSYSSKCEKDCGACTVSPHCGDGTCNVGENCSNCAGDCGACIVPTYCGLDINDTSQTILRLYNQTNSHGATAKEIIYPIGVCYKDIFGHEYFDLSKGTSGFHSADFRGNSTSNGNWIIDDIEVARVLVLSNNNKYYQCLAGTVDGYAPDNLGTGSHSCGPHSADLNKDWKISYSEYGIVSNLKKYGPGYHINTTIIDINSNNPIGFSPDDGPWKCTGTNAIVNLYDTINSHAEIPTLNNYVNKICYGNLVCTNRNSCLPDEKAVVSLNQTTNSHLSNDTNYPIKICCKELAFAPQTPVCGNGVIEAGEACDDGNRNVGDGCNNSTCQVEVGWSCTTTAPNPSVCIPNSNAYWSKDGSLISVLGIAEGSVSVLMNLKNKGLTSENVNFSIYHGQVDSAHWIKNISATVTDGNNVNATWTFSMYDIIDNDGENFYFKVGEVVSNPPLKISILQECLNVNFCSQYTSSASCNQDKCNAGELSVESDNSNIKCGETFDVSGTNYKYNCGCEWNSSIGKCDPTYGRTNTSQITLNIFNSDWVGSCLFDETTTDTCEDDFLSYAWVGNWRNGQALDSAEISGLALTAGTNNRDRDFVKIGQTWYYDPKTADGNFESANCKSSLGDRTVPCPAQIKLPFFTRINFIVSLILISFVYIFVIFGRKTR